MASRCSSRNDGAPGRSESSTASALAFFTLSAFRPQKSTTDIKKAPEEKKAIRGDAELVGQVEGPAEEEVGEDGQWRIGVGGEPLGEGEVEGGEGGHDVDVAGVTDVADVLDARRELGVGREGEDEGVDGGVGGEERVKEGEVLGSDQDGEGESAEGELVREVQVRKHVALRRVGKQQYVRRWRLHGDVEDEAAAVEEEEEEEEEEMLMLTFLMWVLSK
ncbi:hypothetical protein NL676_037728 [Syzygium grande]|nr:hypothetical protein NL676_037728 [Syzygium grande]